MRQPSAPELKLLLACARAQVNPEHIASIRKLLTDEVNWTLFAQKAIAHGLAGLAGHTLDRVVPELVPNDILSAFRTLIDQTRSNNIVLLEELASLTKKLQESGVKTIAFKGPVLAKQAFGDLGLREFRDLDILICGNELTRTVEVLRASGYPRRGDLTRSQFDMIHRLQGQEILFKNDIALEPHTRLTSMKMAIDIDYDGLFDRARSESIFGHSMLTFAPEDTLLVLAIHGGKELWWDIKWASDIADFIASNPQIDWTLVVSRARRQGCYKMLLVACALAHCYLGTEIPEFIARKIQDDSGVEQVIDRIVARWELADPGGPPSNKTVSRDRMNLHDGFVRKVGYIVRTLLLPGPQHVPLVGLPSLLIWAYIPIGLVHDLIALPLYRFGSRLLLHANRLILVSPAALTLAPIKSEARKKLRRLQQAYRRAKRDSENNPEAHVNWIALGDVLLAMKWHKEAIAAYDRSIAILPDQDSIWNKRKMAVTALRQADDQTDVTNEPSFDDRSSAGWAIRAAYLSFCGRHLEAVDASDRALALCPDNGIAARIGIYSRMLVCDWSVRDSDKETIRDGLVSKKIVLRPLTLRQLSDSEEDCFAATQLWRAEAQLSTEAVWKGERYNHKKIRVAYLSTDFRSHPVGSAIVAPLENHDKSRFEVTAVSLLRSNDSMRQRISASVDRFVDVQSMGDGEIALLLRDWEIDIAVDLNGLTGARRTGILARRPAPLQVNYLGYPGTMAAPFIDYIVADHTVIPPENRKFYSEKIAYLPNCYLPYDDKRLIATSTPSRFEAGLPEKGFVFACFNRLQKISPEVFDVWMRLLNRVESSVLWLPGDDPVVIVSLRREAAARGVSPDRLIFANYIKQSEDHLARQGLADLFLDTLPYNAHSTAGDALWAGLPVLTCPGQAFQARVAASLLHAVGLPELVAASLADYEKQAINLANDPVQLAAIRQKLECNRRTMPLFNMNAFARDLETVFTAMWERQQSGKMPEDFSIGEIGMAKETMPNQIDSLAV